MKGRARIAVLLVVVAGVAVAAVATAYAITIEVPARGTFASHQDKTNLLRGVARLQGQSTDAAVQKIVLSPGEGPSWHTHAGPVTVIIKSGNFTIVDGEDCSQTTYTEGQVFVDEGFGHTHRAFNPGPGTTEVWAFYVIPEGAGLIIPASPPACAT